MSDPLTEEARPAGHRWRRRLVIALVSLLLTTVLVELGLRRWYPVGVPSYQADPHLLHTTIPNARRIQLMDKWAGGARNLIEIGPQGYRGVDLAEKQRPRLVVVGDSMVMGENVAYADSLPPQLERALDGKYEVVGLCASGYGPDQELLRLEREWTVLQPDAVLLVLCATNDFGDVVRNKLFRLTRGELVGQRPTLGPDAVGDFRDSAARGNAPALLRAWRAFSVARAQRRDLERELASAPFDYMRAYLEAAAREWSEHLAQPPIVHDLFRDYYDADVALAPESESAQGKRALMNALLAHWAERMAAKRVPLRALIVPSAVDLDPEFHICVDPARFSDYDPRRQTTWLRAGAEAAGIPVLDLFDPYLERGPSEVFVSRYDVHWNARGIALAADLVGAWLRELE